MPGKSFYKSLQPPMRFGPGGGPDLFDQIQEDIRRAEIAERNMRACEELAKKQFRRELDEAIHRTKSEQEAYEKSWKAETREIRHEDRQKIAELHRVERQLEKARNDLLADSFEEAKAAFAEAAWDFAQTTKKHF